MAWNRPSTKNQQEKPNAKAPSAQRGIIAGVVVVALGALCLWMFSGEKVEPKAKVEKERGRIKEVTPAKARTNEVEAVKKPPVVEPVDPLNQKFGKLPDGRWTVPGRKKIHNVVTNYSNVAAESPFRNSTEQLMYDIFSRQRGDMPLPLPRLSDKAKQNLVAVLMDKNPVTDKDSEEMRLGKEVIQEAKDALRAYIKEGGDVDSFFSYYHGELMKSYNERRDAMTLMFEAARNEGPEAAAEFCAKVNERFAQKGIRPLNFPKKMFEVNKEIKK